VELAGVRLPVRGPPPGGDLRGGAGGAGVPVPGRGGLQQGGRHLAQRGRLELGLPRRAGVGPARRGVRGERRAREERGEQQAQDHRLGAVPPASQRIAIGPHAAQQPAQPAGLQAFRPAAWVHRKSHPFGSSAYVKGRVTRSGPARAVLLARSGLWSLAGRPKGRWSRGQVPIGASRRPRARPGWPAKTPMRRKDMTTRVGINGFGRIGRAVTRLALERTDLEVVAVNDITDARTLAHLLEFDSTYGRLGRPVTHTEDSLKIGDLPIAVLSERDPAAIDWKRLGADIVIESTGKFRTRDAAAAHLKGGARKVL